MDYRITVILPSNFERSEYLPHLNKHGKELAQIGGKVCWATDYVDLESLTKAYENREISWFGVSPAPKTYPKKWISRHDPVAPMIKTISKADNVSYVAYLTANLTVCPNT